MTSIFLICTFSLASSLDKRAILYWGYFVSSVISVRSNLSKSPNHFLMAPASDTTTLVITFQCKSQMASNIQTIALSAGSSQQWESPSPTKLTISIEQKSQSYFHLLIFHPVTPLHPQVLVLLAF